MGKPRIPARYLLVVSCATVCALAFLVLPSHFEVAEARDPSHAPDWAATRQHAVSLLSDLIRINTSNGNETRAAEYIAAVLDKEGIPSAIYEAAPGRGNLVARLKGSGRKKPLLLMAHTDVVGVEGQQWSVDPFGGVVKNGYVWGRGAVDDKGMLAAIVETMLLLKRNRVPLDRDIILLAEADEEGAARFGMHYMVEKHWNRIAAEFALNEGGFMLERGGRVRYAGVATTEKVPLTVRLVARGTAGHGSLPRSDNPIVHLAAAVARLSALQMPTRLNDTTRAFFERLAQVSPAEEAYLYKRLENPNESAAAQERIGAMNIGYNSMLRTSIVPTMMRGGFRENVIPAEAEATFDIRALPDENIEDLLALFQTTVDDARVEMIPEDGPRRPPAPPSRLDSPMFRAIERVQQRLYPGAVTIPLMLTGATDSALLRKRGVQAYGLGSIVHDTDRSRTHAEDERISVESLANFVQFLYQTVSESAAR